MKNPNSPKRLSILDAAITVIKTRTEWKTADVAVGASIRKSVVYHYLESKADLVRRACERYVTQAREASDIAFDLAIWVAMRHDEELKRIVRSQREAERQFLQIEFNGHREASLFQALNVGLGVMRELGVKADEDAVRKLFKELVFENHTRDRAPEVKAGVDKELSA